MTNEPQTKDCTGKCGRKNLPLTEFYYYDKAKGRLMAQCKLCRSNYKKETRERTRKRELQKTYTYEDPKLCTGPCAEFKSLDEYWYKCKATGQLDSKCIVCRQLINDPDQKHDQQQNWYYNKGGKEWCKQYQETYKPKRNARNKERRITDLDYLITQLFRSRIYDVLNRHNISMTCKIKALGINKLLYLIWLEFQFTGEMTWENQGSYWHIDHVIPCASFTFTSRDDPAIYECFNWKNTRPMVATDNLSKGDTVDLQEIARHQMIVEEFIEAMGLEADA
jgi:hypothetical protein